MKKIILGTILSCLISLNAVGKSFEATVNRNSLPEGETFVLTLDLQGDDTQTAPDLSPLSKDFTVLSVSNGYRTSIINGQVDKSRQWNLVMIPRQSGEVIIPAIELDGYKTQPITIKVLKASELETLVSSKASASSQFKMNGKIDNLSPYVQQQLNYRLKIYDIGGLQGEAPYFATADNDWVIRSLGEPKVETKIVNGKNLREITFDYALFAQKSGELTVPEVRFNGYYLTKNTRVDPFSQLFEDDIFFSGFAMNDVFAKKTPVVLTAKPIKVNVKPAETTTGWWLPAKSLNLSAEFETSAPEFKVGEAVRRTIYLKAVGVMSTQLPEIKFPEIEGVKQYPEKPQMEMKVEDGQVVSYAKIANVYIPETNGEITLPEIKVGWFNTNNGENETAIIPAYKTKVALGSGQSVSTTAKSEQTKPIVAETKKDVATQEPTVSEIKTLDNMTIIGLLVLAFACGIVITLLLLKLFMWTNQKSSNRKKEIIAAAKAKNMPLLRDELLLWAVNEFPHHKITNLQDIADIFQNVNLNKELDKLREALYSETAQNWDSQEFLDVFTKISKQTKKHQRTSDEPLPKLYK